MAEKISNMKELVTYQESSIVSKEIILPVSSPLHMRP